MSPGKAIKQGENGGRGRDLPAIAPAVWVMYCDRYTRGHDPYNWMGIELWLHKYPEHQPKGPNSMPDYRLIRKAQALSLIHI